MSIVGRLCVESNVPLEAGSLIRFNASTKPNTIKVDEQGAHAGVLLERHPGYNKLVWSGVHLEGPINVAISSDGAIIKTLDPLYITWNGECFAVTLSSDGSCLIGRSIQSCNPSLQATLAIDVRDNPPIIETSTAVVPFSAREPQLTLTNAGRLLLQNIQASMRRVLLEQSANNKVSAIAKLAPRERLFEYKPERGFEFSKNRLVFIKANVTPLEIYRRGGGVPIVPDTAFPIIIKDVHPEQNKLSVFTNGQPRIQLKFDTQNPPETSPGSPVFVQWDHSGLHGWGHGPGGVFIGNLVKYDKKSMRRENREAGREIYRMCSVTVDYEPQIREKTQDEMLFNKLRPLRYIGNKLAEQIEGNRPKTRDALADELLAEIENLVSNDNDRWSALSKLYRLAYSIWRLHESATSDEVRDALQSVKQTLRVNRTRIHPAQQPDPVHWRQILDDLKRSRVNELGHVAADIDVSSILSAVDKKKAIATRLGVPESVIHVAITRGLIGNPSKTGYTKDASQAIDEAIAEELEE